MFFLRLSAFGDSTDPNYYAEEERGISIDGAIGHTVTVHKGRLHALSFSWVDELEERMIGKSLRDVARSIDSMHLVGRVDWNPALVSRLAQSLLFAQHHLVAVSRMKLDNGEYVPLSDSHNTCAWIGNSLESLPRAPEKARLDDLQVPEWVGKMKLDDKSYFIKGLTKIPELDSGTASTLETRL